MTILQPPTMLTGTPGIYPNFKYMTTTDNLATITTAGYLNQPALEVTPVGVGDIIQCLYNVNVQAGTSSYGVFTVTINKANAAITMVAWTGDTGVTLPTIAGQFASFSNTTGTIASSGVTVSSVSSAITQIGALTQVAVTLTPTQMAAAYATPIQLIANPAASQLIIVHSATVYTASTGNTAYATGTAPIIQYGTGGTNGAHGAGTIATAAGLVAGDITAATSQVRTLLQAASAAVTGLSGNGVYFSNATGAYTAGTGTNVTFTLVYETITATV